MLNCIVDARHARNAKPGVSKLVCGGLRTNEPKNIVYGVSKENVRFSEPYFDDNIYSLRYRWALEPKILDRLFTLQELQRGTSEGLFELLAPGVTTGKANGVPAKLWLDPDGVAGPADA